MKNKTIFFLLFGFSFLSLKAQDPKPNIIFIIADDQGWSQVSTGKTNINNGSDFYETPVLDRLANEGIAFTHGYANGANCAPTRAAILSGQYAVRETNNVYAVDHLNRKNGASSSLCGPSNGLPNGQDQIPGSAITIAEVLKTAGYTTAHFGKYHVGGSTNTNRPQDQGFDFNYGGGSAGNPGNYFASNSGGNWRFSSSIGVELDPFAQPYTEAESQAYAGSSVLTNTKKHVTDAMTDAALDFIGNNTGGRPFFMHFSQYAIHGPFNTANARPDLVSKYQTKKNNTPSQMGHDNVGQGAILEGMDQAIGRLIDYLKNTDDPRNLGHKLADNTLVYYVSDNGGTVSSDDNGPLKGKKGEFDEGGIRSVTLAWSPGLVANPSTVVNTSVLTFDVYPTFAELAGASLPDNYPIDGVSILPIINGIDVDMDRGALFWHFPGYLISGARNARPETVIRKGDYKLRYTYENQKYKLYNITNDMGETVDLIAEANSPTEEHRQIAIDLSEELIDYLTNTNAKLPLKQNANGSCSSVEVDLPEVYTADVLPNDQGITLVAHYEFNGDYTSSGGTYTDVLTPTETNTFSFVSDNNGNANSALDISGTNTTSQMVGTNDFPISGTTARTYTAWVKLPTGSSGLRTVLETGYNADGNGRRFTLLINDSGILNMGIRGTGCLGTTVINDDKWTFIAGVMDSSQGAATYIAEENNSIVVAEQTANFSSANTSISPLLVAYGSQANRPFIGSIADLRVYEGALTVAQLNTVKSGASLSVADIAFGKNELKAYPNAVEDYLTIETTSSKRLQVTVFSLLGKSVKKEFSNRIDMSDLSSGVYFVKVRAGSKVGTLKIIKK